MIREIPLPIPCSVISWPIQTPSKVPAVMPMMIVIVGNQALAEKPQSGKTVTPPAASLLSSVP